MADSETFDVTPATRRIDEDPRSRKREMRVLVLGLPRTGTTSLIHALRKLGYTPHTMREILVRPKEIPLWQEAVDTTLLSKSQLPPDQRRWRPYGRKEFDKLLDDYDVVTDLPGCMFAEPLIKAYPEAKVILTKRYYKDWEASMQESIWALMTWKIFTFCRTWNVTQMAPLLRLLHSLFTAHNGNNYGGAKAKAAYEQHYETVRDLVPANQLLELDQDMEWEPICEFLDKEVPDDAGAFPKMEEGGQMQAQMLTAWEGARWYLFTIIILPLGGALLGLAFIYWREPILNHFDATSRQLEKYAALAKERERRIKVTFDE